MIFIKINTKPSSKAGFFDGFHAGFDFKNVEVYCGVKALKSDGFLLCINIFAAFKN